MVAFVRVKRLTHQHHCATALGKDYLEFLESINYKAESMHRERESDNIQWELQFSRLKQGNGETGGDKINIKDKALST